MFSKVCELAQNCVVIIITKINSGIDNTPTTTDQLNKPHDKPCFLFFWWQRNLNNENEKKKKR